MFQIRDKKYYYQHNTNGTTRNITKNKVGDIVMIYDWNNSLIQYGLEWGLNGNKSPIFKILEIDNNKVYLKVLQPSYCETRYCQFYHIDNVLAALKDNELGVFETAINFYLYTEKVKKIIVLDIRLSHCTEKCRYENECDDKMHWCDQKIQDCHNCVHGEHFLQTEDQRNQQSPFLNHMGNEHGVQLEKEYYAEELYPTQHVDEVDVEPVELAYYEQDYFAEHTEVGYELQAEVEDILTSEEKNVVPSLNLDSSKEKVEMPLELESHKSDQLLTQEQALAQLAACPKPIPHHQNRYLCFPMESVAGCTPINRHEFPHKVKYLVEANPLYGVCELCEVTGKWVYTNTLGTLVTDAFQVRVVNIQGKDKIIKVIIKIQDFESDFGIRTEEIKKVAKEWHGKTFRTGRLQELGAFIQNRGKEPIIVQMQYSPDKRVYVDMTPIETVNPGETKYITPYFYTPYMRLRFENDTDAEINVFVWYFGVTYS